MTESIGQGPQGAVPPLNTHSVTPETSQQMLGVAAFLVHQTLSKVHEMTKHSAVQLNLPMSQSHEMGSNHVWVR